MARKWKKIEVPYIKTSRCIGNRTVDMKTYENFTITVEQLIGGLESIASANPNKTLSFNHYGTTLYIDDYIKSMPKYNTVILSSSPKSIFAISVKELLDKLREKEETAKVLLQGKAVVDDRTMSLARDLPMDDGDQRKYRNQILRLI